MPTGSTSPMSARAGGMLPFKNLPASTELTSPEDSLMQDVNLGRQQIQQKYALQWQTINANAKFLGPIKHQAMLQQVDLAAKQEMLDFNQKAEQQLVQLKRISNLPGITEDTAERLKSNIVYGRDVAEAMYPEQPASKTIEQVYGTLDVHENRLKSRLQEFRMTKERVPAMLARKGRLGWPLPKEGLKPGKVEVFDDSIPVEDKDGNITMGNWREASPEEVQERIQIVREYGRVKAAKSALLSGRDVQQRVVQPGTTGGTFGDKIKRSIGKSETEPEEVEDPLGLLR